MKHNPLTPAQAGALTYPEHYLIDIAPLSKRYAAIMVAIMGFIEAGRTQDMLRLTHKLGRLVRVFTQLETQNILLKRKLDMLSHKPWRDLVLKELGGMKRLKLWEAAYKRIMQRMKAPASKAAELAPAHDPAWLYTPERLAESERLKAHKRLCGKATAPERVFRERCQMDFDGAFRLAPLPRAPQTPRRIKVYTAASIVDYDWNNMPLAEVTGLGPARVWPAEFYAAMKIEAQILESSQADADPKDCEPSLGVDPASPVHDGRYHRRNSIIPIISLKEYLSPKVYDDLIGSPLS